MKKLMARIILLAICSIIIGYFLSQLCGSVPVVYWSVSKNECIKIIVFDRNKKEWVEKDCSTIPKQYEKIWVE